MAVAKNKKALSRETSVKTIKAASMKLFVDQGYANFRVEDLAAICGFTKGTVYHYYRSKEEILFELLEDIEQSILDEPLKLGDEKAGSATDRLVRFLSGHARYAMQNPQEFSLLVVIAMEFSNTDGRIGEKINAIFDRLTDALEHLIAAGLATGEFTTSLSSRDFSRVIVGCYNGNVVEWKRSKFDPVVGAALVKGVRTLIISALGKTAPAKHLPPA